MCQLFGVSSRLPTNVRFSLKVFGARGGGSEPHGDGWGIAFHQGRDFRIIKEAAPAFDSACLDFIETHDFSSEIVISHIRQASAPKALSYANTHPFVRELFGYAHVFAHNGDIPGMLDESRRQPSFYLPLGDTDSESAFCLLMDRLRNELSRETVLDLSRKLPIVQSWAKEVSRFGIFNFLLSDTEFLYAHRTTQLFYVSRECLAASECLQGAELTIRMSQPQSETQRLALVATEPLTDSEEWASLPEGEVIVFHNGSRVGLGDEKLFSFEYQSYDQEKTEADHK